MNGYGSERQPTSSLRPDGSVTTAIQRRLRDAIRSEEEGRYSEALRLLDGILAEDPTCLSARLHRGKICVFTGQVEQAAAEFNAVLIQDEENLAARLHLAALFILMGLQGDAELYFRLAMLCSTFQEEPDDALSAPRRIGARPAFPRFSQN